MSLSLSFLYSQDIVNVCVSSLYNCKHYLSIMSYTCPIHHVLYMSNPSCPIHVQFTMSCTCPIHHVLYMSNSSYPDYYVRFIILRLLANVYEWCCSQPCCLLCAAHLSITLGMSHMHAILLLLLLLLDVVVRCYISCRHSLS